MVFRDRGRHLRPVEQSPEIKDLSLDQTFLPLVYKLHERLRPEMPVPRELGFAPVCRPVHNLFDRNLGVSITEYINVKRPMIKYSGLVFQRLMENSPVGLEPTVGQIFGLSHIAGHMIAGNVVATRNIAEAQNNPYRRHVLHWQLAAGLAIEYASLSSQQEIIRNIFMNADRDVRMDYREEVTGLQERAKGISREIPEHMLLTPAQVVGVLQPLRPKHIPEFVS